MAVTAARPISTSNQRRLQAVELCREDTPHDPLSVFGATRAGPFVAVRGGFSGGCRSHDVGVCWDGELDEGDPPTAHLRIIHESNDDPCESFAHVEWLFDVRTIYEDMGLTESGPDAGRGRDTRALERVTQPPAPGPTA